MIEKIAITFLVIIMTIFQAGLALAQDVVPRSINTSAISLPEGYAIEAVVSNLSVPTTAIFDGEDLLIAESGWLNTARPRILRVSPDGKVETLAEEGLSGPVTGLLKVNDKLYVSHRGKVSVVEDNKQLKDIVSGLPSFGDHQNNNIVLGNDGKIYLGQGTVTNSGVVGEDNYVQGWLLEHPEAHDVPCKDIVLTGQNFTTKDVLHDGEGEAVTGAYKPFGTPSQPGEVIKGNPKCSGSILRFNPDGSDLEVVAWGLRNPFGLKFDTNNQLWATFHGADVRGSRNIYNDPDYLIQVKEGAWYGWPDYFEGQPVTDSRFKDPTKPQPTFLLQDQPEVTEPFVTFDSHAAANGFAFSPDEKFGFTGDAFVAMFGSFSVATSGTNPRLPGFKVVRVDMATKEISDFATNRVGGPDYINRQGGFNRVSDIVFAPDSSMYIVDWGATTVGDQGIKYAAGTGVIWRVYPTSMQPVRASETIKVVAAPIPKDQQKAEVRNIPEAYKQAAGPVGLMLGAVLFIIIFMIWIIRTLKKREK